jgi:tetratricopeptide (TPR) repeat protein
MLDTIPSLCGNGPMLSLDLGVLLRFQQPSGNQNRLRLALACVQCAVVLLSAAAGAPQPAASAAPIPAAPVAPEDLARMWSEAVKLERTSWDCDESEAARSYDLAVEAARRFEIVTDWYVGATTPDVEPYRHAYWRTARAHWLAADSLELSERARRREHLNRAIEFSDRGVAADPDCAACMLWKFNSMGRRQQIDGLLSGARNVKSMAQLLDRAIALQPDFREDERSSTLGNLHYVSAIFYRVLPDWFWLRWILGVRGDKERALEHARTALAMHASRIDYRIEVGSQLVCLGATKDNPERLAEGRRALIEASRLRPDNVDEEREIAAARVMIAAPKKACSYAGAEWVEIDESGAVASMK